MGGKNSGGGTSTTSVEIPAWIQGALEPLLKGSAGKLTAFQNQGWDVLQGQGTPAAMSLEEVNAMANQVPPSATGAVGSASGGGGGAGARNLMQR